MNKNHKDHLSITPGVGVKVVKTKRNPNGDIELALRKLKKEIKDSGKIQKLKDNRAFVSKKDKQRKLVERARYFQQVASKELSNS
tara:strand:+ start:89 stop:343 length:255 start_codon:yes stop_codon:yes gene_type:complete